VKIVIFGLDASEQVSYIGSSGFRDFDLVLSHSGGRAFDEFSKRFGAGNVAALDGHVDPDLHRSVRPLPHDCRSDRSCIETYSKGGQNMLKALLAEEA
jgi:hypothetical protein